MKMRRMSCAALVDTFSSLGLTPGTYVYNLPQDTYTIEVPSAVPIPASAWLMLGGLALIGLPQSRRLSGGLPRLNSVD